MGLEKLTLEKVRQLQKYDVFYGAMYHYLQNGGLARRKVKFSVCYTIPNLQVIMEYLRCMRTR